MGVAVVDAIKDDMKAAPLFYETHHPPSFSTVRDNNATNDTSTHPPPEPPLGTTHLCELDEWNVLTEESQWMHARIGWNPEMWGEQVRVTSENDMENVFWDNVCKEYKGVLTSQGWSRDMWNERVHERAGACQVSKWNDLSEQSKQVYQEEDGLSEEEWNFDRWIHNRQDAEGILWEDICHSYRQELQARGWNKEAWNDHDGTKMSFYNEAELNWEELSEDRRQQYIDDGYTERSYHRLARNAEDGSHNDILAPAGEFDPRVLSLHVPEVQALNFTYLATLNVEVGLVDSIPDEESESFIEAAPMGEYVKRIQAGENHTYAQMEDGDRFKRNLWKSIGSKVMRYLGTAIEASELVEYGYYKREWMDLENGAYDWAIFMGGKSTKTAMHFDTDTFSFLYVVEGKKRVVMLENTGLVNETRFNVSSFFTGSAWTDLNILEPENQPEGTVVMDVGPGQGIMIPHRAWHSVENLEHTIAYALRIMNVND